MSFTEVGNLQIVYAELDSTDIDSIKLLKTLKEPKDRVQPIPDSVQASLALTGDGYIVVRLLTKFKQLAQTT